MIDPAVNARLITVEKNLREILTRLEAIEGKQKAGPAHVVDSSSSGSSKPESPAPSKPAHPRAANLS